MNAALTVLAGLAVYQLGVTAFEWDERLRVYDTARAVADARGKPLLNVGCSVTQLQAYPCGDSCLDIDPERLRYCRSAEPILADVRNTNIPSGYFGACTCFHTLEHLPTVRDAELALRELRRISDQVFVLCPHRWNLSAWVHPDHQLWVDTKAAEVTAIEQRCRGEKCGELGYGAKSAFWSALQQFGAALRTGQQSSAVALHASADYGR